MKTSMESWVSFLLLLRQNEPPLANILLAGAEVKGLLAGNYNKNTLTCVIFSMHKLQCLTSTVAKAFAVSHSLLPARCPDICI